MKSPEGVAIPIPEILFQQAMRRIRHEDDLGDNFEGVFNVGVGSGASVTTSRTEIKGFAREGVVASHVGSFTSSTLCLPASELSGMVGGGRGKSHGLGTIAAGIILLKE